MIPLAYGSKKPEIGWKPYEYQQPTNDELLAWFVTQPTNVALVCGSIAGSFVVLDFDVAGLFWEFAEKRQALRGADIHDETPVVATGTGFHVYVKCRTPVPSRKFRKGWEIGSDGNYVAAQPSLHPEGSTHCFITPETDLREISDLAEIGVDVPTPTHAHPDSSQDKVAEIANLIASHWETGLHHELALAMEALPGVPIREVSVTDSVAQERS